jgi:hypothetical protein
LDIAPAHRRLRDNRTMLQHLLSEILLINTDIILPRVILQHPAKKRLREKEARDPEHIRRASLDPIVKHFDSIVLVLDVPS